MISEYNLQEFYLGRSLTEKKHDKDLAFFDKEMSSLTYSNKSFKWNQIILEFQIPTVTWVV